MASRFWSGHPRVLILHWEGSFNYNTNLMGICEVLAEAGFRVTLAARRRDYRQAPWRDDVGVWIWPAEFEQILARYQGRRLGAIVNGATLYWRFPQLRADLYIGVDGEGIIRARTLARVAMAPHALLSYEIMFAQEAGPAIKDPEIAACRGLAFAVAQDPLRADALARENSIAPARVIQIPVAGRGARSPRPGALGARLGIPAGRRIAVYMGSVAPWALVDELIDNTRHWPDDWCLVVHNRFGFAPDWVAAFHGRPRGQVYLSMEPVDAADDLADLLGDADIGVGLYRPTYASRWEGDNLRLLGLASGKIATYLQYGVPVLTNRVGAYDAAIVRDGLGLSVAAIDEIPAALAALPPTTAAVAQRCRAYFARSLDLDVFAPRIVGACAAALACRVGP